jgi:t-SNARE complex subunit (syntaxin)
LFHVYEEEETFIMVLFLISVRYKMVEEVQTGGLMKFKYEKGQGGKLDDEEIKEIDSAYDNARERKRRERRKRIILLVMIIVVIFIAVWGIWFFT